MSANIVCFKIRRGTLGVPPRKPRRARAPVLAPAGEVLSLAPEKVPKERVQGAVPLDTPAQKRCQHSFPASETRRYADSFDGLRPCSQQLSAVVRTQVTAWPGDGQGFVSRLAGRRNRFRALPVQAPQGGVLSNHPGGTRAEPAGGTFQVSMLPPEGEHGTPT